MGGTFVRRDAYTAELPGMDLGGVFRSVRVVPAQSKLRAAFIRAVYGVGAARLSGQVAVTSTTATKSPTRDKSL